MLNKQLMELLKVDSNIVLIDVRDKSSYASGHLKNSINLPLETLVLNINKIIPNKLTRVFVYCDMGNKSRNAEYILRQQGYLNTYNLGGVRGYKDLVK
ncbi:MAG: rhodanese-like domain-containing protein [Erysipelotrichales bacterium]|nr:rhodanese-like domain-containing protein [Erysipelotrichales bacterium]